MKNKKKENRKRFEMLAASRVTKVLKYLQHLKLCSNKKHHEYTKADVEKIFNAIKKQVTETENAFEQELARKPEKKKSKPFFRLK